MKLTENADSDKYGCSGHGIRFDARLQFCLSIGEWGKNVVISGVGNSSPMHTDDRMKDILVHGEGPTGRLDDTTITSETKYSVNITKVRKKSQCSQQFFIF